MKVRLQKLIAEAGIASRRAAERLIVDGRVEVNGQVVTQLGTKVDAAADHVVVEGRRIQSRRRLTVVLHKPWGYVCSRTRQAAAQRLVTDLLPPEWQSLYPVGRLDRESEGLLLLTNDGEFCLHLTHPRYGVVKKYVATVVGKVDTSVTTRLRAGIQHDGETLRARSARILSATASHSIVELELAEGKHHEVRRLFASVGFEVERLQRTQIGSLKLAELKPGKWRVLGAAEIASLLKPAAKPAVTGTPVDRSPRAISNKAKP